MKKRIVALICLVAVCMSIPIVTPAKATNVGNAIPNQPPGRWTNVSVVALNITFSSGTAYCDGTIVAKSDVIRIEATFQLQKKNASGSFVTEYTWPKVTVNDNYLTWSGSRTVTPGVFRLQVTAIATNRSNVSETVVTYCEKEYK